MTKYLYICSHRHSGSTLLDLILGAHSKIESLGEIDFLPQDLALNGPCSCGSSIRDCKVWREVVERLSAKLGIDIMANPYVLNLGYPKASVVIDRARQTRAYLLRRDLMLGLLYAQLKSGSTLLKGFLGPITKGLANTCLVYDAVADVLKASVVVDSSKTYLKAIALYRFRPHNVRVVLLTRDGRGVLSSDLKRKRPRSDSVSGWIRQNTRALPLLRAHVEPQHLLQVKYEQLVSDPTRELTRICQFVELEFEPAMLDFAAAVHHSTHGNNVRLGRSSAIRAGDEWTQHLSDDDLEYFEHRAGWLNRELGYT